MEKTHLPVSSLRDEGWATVAWKYGRGRDRQSRGVREAHRLLQGGRSNVHTSIRGNERVAHSEEHSQGSRSWPRTAVGSGAGRKVARVGWDLAAEGLALR